jgi:hypothetical protein
MCRKEGCKKTKEPWCGDHTKYGIKEELEKEGKKVKHFVYYKLN